MSGTNWYTEVQSNNAKLAIAGPSTFAEKCLDRYLINWYIGCTATYFPHLKKIFVDYRDEDLFNQIDRSESKKIVVVVNQWHMEGIEHHWAHRYGQYPRSVEFKEPINPIGDMDLRRGLFE